MVSGVRSSSFPDNQGRVTAELTAWSGARVGEHRHPPCRALHVLEGELTLKLDGRRVRARQGVRGRRVARLVERERARRAGTGGDHGSASPHDRDSASGLYVNGRHRIHAARAVQEFSDVIVSFTAVAVQRALFGVSHDRALARLSRDLPAEVATRADQGPDAVWGEGADLGGATPDASVLREDHPAFSSCALKPYRVGDAGRVDVPLDILPGVRGAVPCGCCSCSVSSHPGAPNLTAPASRRPERRHSPPTAWRRACSGERTLLAPRLVEPDGGLDEHCGGIAALRRSEGER